MDQISETYIDTKIADERERERERESNIDIYIYTEQYLNQVGHREKLHTRNMKMISAVAAV